MDNMSDLPHNDVIGEGDDSSHLRIYISLTDEHVFKAYPVLSELALSYVYILLNRIIINTIVISHNNTGKYLVRETNLLSNMRIILHYIHSNTQTEMAQNIILVIGNLYLIDEQTRMKITNSEILDRICTNVYRVFLGNRKICEDLLWLFANLIDDKFDLAFNIQNLLITISIELVDSCYKSVQKLDLSDLMFIFYYYMNKKLKRADRVEFLISSKFLPYLAGQYVEKIVESDDKSLMACTKFFFYLGEFQVFDYLPQGICEVGYSLFRSS